MYIVTITIQKRNKETDAKSQENIFIAFVNMKWL